MFERFTERARQVIVLAQEEARILKHNYIGTEHMLLGLLREEEGLAARVLEVLGVTVERVRAEVVSIVGSGEELVTGQIPFTPRAKKVCEFALREALSLGHNYIGTEHILVGLARENNGIAARVLLDFDVDSELIRNEVIRMLSGPGSGSPVGRGGSRGAPSLERPALLDGAGPPLRRLIQEIGERLGRDADAGDLLVLLASVPGGLAARALASLGMEPDAIARATESARKDGARSALLPPAELLAECEEVRAEKEAAIAAREFERAANLREKEREHTNRAYDGVMTEHEEVLAEVRARLGIGAEE